MENLWLVLGFIKYTWDNSNIKAKKHHRRNKVNESDGYCAALPYYIYNNNEKDLKKVIKSVANSKINETYAMAKLKIIDLAANGEKNPIQTFVRKYKKIDISRM